VRGTTHPAAVRYALWALAWARALRGQPLEELCAQSGVATDPSGYISASPERVAAFRLVWRGERERARQTLDALLALADERGDLTSYAMVRMHSVELEIRAGNFDAAATLLDEWAESSDYETQFRPQHPRCRALLLAGLGALEEARKCASDTIALAQQAGSRWDELEARRALGIAALLEGAAEQALAELEPVWEHCEREGVLDPGAFPVAGELVEALVELERFDDARAVVDRLHDQAAGQEHPWAQVTVKRCAAILGLATSGSPEGDAALLRDATREFEQLGLRFDAARCLLALGRAQRRLKRWRNAREALEQVIVAFLALGAEGWADRARAELARVGGRRGGDGALTPSERRVVELAAEGRSNKEIAGALYVSVNTVETHLARAYAKLGVRSRAQLARRLAGGA
jgi:DNA-binding CsgD family transcriptional regulator